MKRDNQLIEEIARVIYDMFEYNDEGEKPAWQTGGNSSKQDEARELAVKSMTAIREAASNHCSADGRATYIWIGKQLDAAGMIDREKIIQKVINKTNVIDDMPEHNEDRR